MLGRMLPKGVKDYLKTEFRWLMKANLPALKPDLMIQAEGFFPHEEGSETFVLPKTPEPGEYVSGSSFPVPNAILRGIYGPTPEAYLESGRRDVQRMREILQKAGTQVESAGRILDFGCSSGRMVRWFEDVSGVCEVWGTDIRANRIFWCQQYLSPPFHFTISTLTPHLPFEDRYFGLIYAGSVFTHIDDMAHPWFLELRRILKPGGRLYITIHDRNTVAIMADKNNPDLAFFDGTRQLPEYQRYSRSNFGMFTIGRSLNAQVFHDVEFLAKLLTPFYRVLSVTKEAYGYQTAVLLERV